MKLTGVYEKIVDICKVYKDNRRKLTFIPPSSSSSYTSISQQKIQWQIPNECIDNTDAYFSGLLSFPNATDEVPQIYTLTTGASGLTPAGGIMRFYINAEYATVPLPYNATYEQVIASLSSIPFLTSYNLTVTPTNGALNVANNVYTITFSGFNRYGYIPFNLLIDTGIYSNNLILAETQAGVLTYPRIERFNPILSQIELIAGGNSYVINNVSVLMGINGLCNPNNNVKYEHFIRYNGIEGSSNGVNNISLTIDLGFLDLFKAVWPFCVFESGQQILLNLTLENSLLSCIHNDTTLANPNLYYFQLEDLRYYYHRLDLESSDIAMLKEAYRNEGLIIPFIGHTDYTTTYAGGSSSQTLNYTADVKELVGAIFVFSKDGYRQDPTNEAKCSCYVGCNMGQYRMKVGSINYPENYVDTGPLRNLIMPTVRESMNAIAVWKSKFSTYNELKSAQFLNFYTSRNDDNAADLEFDDISGEYQPQTMIRGISCATVGYANMYSKCDKTIVSGINCVGKQLSIELRNMTAGTPLGPENLTSFSIFIYFLSQNYLVLKPGNINFVK